MAKEIFSRPNLHERMCSAGGVDLSGACIPSGLSTDLATAPGDKYIRNKQGKIMLSTRLFFFFKKYYLINGFASLEKKNNFILSSW